MAARHAGLGATAVGTGGYAASELGGALSGYGPVEHEDGFRLALERAG